MQPPTRFLSKAQLEERGIVYCNTHLLRLERANQFPKRVHLGANRIVWVEREIEEWICGRISARDNGSPVMGGPVSSNIETPP